MAHVQELTPTAPASQAGALGIDYSSSAYCDAYSRINAIVIEGELEAHRNYLQLAEMLPEEADELKRLAKMEQRHMKGFQACGRNLQVEPDMEFARAFFSQLHSNFQTAAAAGELVTCFVIQSLIIECFAIAAYNIYIPVADDFARKITEGVVKEEYMHLNFGEVWLQKHFAEIKDQIEAANAENLPLIWKMLQQVDQDVDGLSMDREAIVEDFMIAYGEALNTIGFTTREIMKLSAQGLRAA
ncbi:MAG: aldehyde oxygenase (deformylating) [Synechococcaceae cyanobacterium SM2_3_1]|nr:aldehyde oxygenase (deformylating) [Synechococcaceae cyanobacterium SM2_3_1]